MLLYIFINSKVHPGQDSCFYTLSREPHLFLKLLALSKYNTDDFSWLIMSHVSIGLRSLVKYPRFRELQKWQNISHPLCSFTWAQLSWLAAELCNITRANIWRHSGRFLELLHGRKRINVISNLEPFVSHTGLKMKIPPLKRENFQLIKVGSILMWKWIEHWTKIQETWKYVVVCPFNSVCVIQLTRWVA